MEGVGVAASFITVVLVGLQSSKFIYEIASEISGGPTTVQKLTKATRNLSKLLEQVRGLAQQANDLLGEHDARFFEDFRPLLCECVRELQLIQRKLDKFDRTPGHKFWNNVKMHLHEKDFDKMWNTIHHYVQVLGSHLVHAGIDLNLLSTEYLQLVGDEVTAGFGDTKQCLDTLQMVSRKGTDQADMHHQEIKSALWHGFGTAEASIGHQSAKLDDLQSSLAQISSVTNDSMTKWDRLEMNLEGKDKRLLHTLDEVSDRLRGVSSMSLEQSSTIQQLARMIEGLQLDLQGMRHDLQQAKHDTSANSDSSNLDPSKEEALDSNGVYGSVSRLCSLAAVKDQEFFSVEAQSIIQDLSKITASVLDDTISAAVAESHLETLDKKPVYFSDMQGEIKRRKNDTLKQIENILRVSQRLCIGKQECPNVQKRSLPMDQPAAPRRRRLSNNATTSTVGIDENLLPRFSPSSILQSKSIDDTAEYQGAILRRRHGRNHCSKMDSKPVFSRHCVSTAPIEAGNHVTLTKVVPFEPLYTFKSGCFSLQMTAARVDVRFKKQCVLGRHHISNDSSTGDPTPEETFSAEMVLTPASRTNLRTKIILGVSQQWTNTSSILSTPILSFRSIVPESSEIFDIVRYGTVCDLHQALSRGSASLTDCDPDGRSLLNYAVTALRPKMVRFLTEAGADVNSVERDLFGDSCPALLWSIYNDFQSGAEELYLRAECIKLLLARGADPSMMFEDPGLNLSVFRLGLWRSSLAILRAYLNSESPFIGPNSLGTDNSDSFPLGELAYIHTLNCVEDFETPNKIALLLARGADVNRRDSLGNNCLHAVLNYPDHSWRRKEDPEGQAELRDILMLMITAGADVYAVNDDEETVSRVARDSGHCRIWVEVLEACGFSSYKVTRGDDAEYGWSSALDNSFSRLPARPTSKLSFAEYLEQREEKRKASGRATEIIDEETVEEDWVEEMKIQDGIGISDSDSDVDGEDEEKMKRSLAEDEDHISEGEDSEDICDDEIKWD
ncbi:hypothetical protein EPUS_07183 [Endocarpon pusillum Z07020]|uniref:Uncharacterized protein n=1 Tax=Endocarpon pusillum (strain Z07020 / HMAS-L-300199) TaxID=1263415 RepID=U1FV09_ENDPU|nr:uncharacterized protein EPUS_07183 [Endocarpon pusillum Z07020]ERF68622.1 hypothetical protein EPUS_07183 [Endocarpon pusillum Z07020]